MITKKNKTILFDIIHPANVHYFKYTIRMLQNNGYNVVITSRDKEITYQLLLAEGFDFISMGKNLKSNWGKALFLLWCELKMFFVFLKHRPDISLSFGASYVAHNSFLFRKIHISLDDTEHATLNRKLYLPFTAAVLTPESYWLNLGQKQLKFKGHMELFYLSKKYFKPDYEVIRSVGIKENEPYVFLRFVSWNALHDTNQQGLSAAFKIELVNTLVKKNYRVLISSEGDLPDELKPYRIKIAPEKIHHVLFFATLFVGEGATMASECAAIGTPAIYVNSLNAGTLEQQQKDGLILSFRNQEGVMEKVHEFLDNKNIKAELQKKLKNLSAKRMELPDFLYWFITKFPESMKIAKTDKDWEQQFKIEE